MRSSNGPLRVGVGGPVGAGKTALTEMPYKAMRDDYSVAVVTNDFFTKEDQLILNRVQALPQERIIGVETGDCPHSAKREDASINLDAMRADTEKQRGTRPFVFTGVRRRRELDTIIEFLVEHGGLSRQPEPEAGKGVP